MSMVVCRGNEKRIIKKKMSPSNNFSITKPTLDPFQRKSTLSIGSLIVKTV